ncbi:MAG: hypothetical protein ACI861_001624 [Paracoccaceae bacterium]|jgi:hypothetical protein
MTFTPTPGFQPGKRNYDSDIPSDKSTDVLRSRVPARQAQNMKQNHVRNFAAPVQRAQIQSRAETPARNRYGISVLLDDGSISSVDHMAPGELFLEDICACFGRGTLIATPQGQIAVEDLKPGDKIKTRDSGDQVLRWISSCALPSGDSDQAGEMALRIKADALGELRPMQDLVVSPRFRLLTNHPSCEALFGSPETLAPAADLLDGDTILQVRPAPGLEFFNLMFDSHQIVEANGLATESYHPGNFGVAVMSLEMQSHLRQIFPHLNGDLTRFGRTVRPILKGFEAEVLRVG